MKKKLRLVVPTFALLMIFSTLHINADVKQNAVSEFEKKASLDSIIKEIIAVPALGDAKWGMEFYDLNSNEAVYSLNSNQFYNPASSLKIFTAGTIYAALGGDFRFHTPVYRTGPVVNDVLIGDLVLQASGDLLLGGRINADGTLNLPETDHSYNISGSAVPVSDDPIRSIRDIVDQIAASGIRKIEGNVIVDNSLFNETVDSVGGTGPYTISPMMINDNIVDVIVTPGKNVGEPASIRVLPETPYVTIINQVITSEPAKNNGAAGGSMVTNTPFASKPQFTDEIKNPDGTYTVTLTGDVPLGNRSILCAYIVKEPARFAETVLTMLLNEKGIDVRIDLTKSNNFESLSNAYTDENKVAELVSPSLDEELQPMLKLSSNLHTVTWPYLIGAIAGGNSESAKQTGEAFRNTLFAQTGVEVFAADDSSGNEMYSPRSFTNFLKYLYNQPYLDNFMNNLPILGVDGTLSEINPDSAAAGHVYAKTGGAMGMRPGGGFRLVRALAGYIVLPDGNMIVFSVFTECVSEKTPDMRAALQVISNVVNVVYEYSVNG